MRQTRAVCQKEYSKRISALKAVVEGFRDLQRVSACSVVRLCPAARRVVSGKPDCQHLGRLGVSDDEIAGIAPLEQRKDGIQLDISACASRSFNGQGAFETSFKPIEKTRRKIVAGLATCIIFANQSG